MATDHAINPKDEIRAFTYFCHDLSHRQTRAMLNLAIRFFNHNNHDTSWANNTADSIFIY